MKSRDKVRILHIGPLPPEVSGGKAAGGIGTHCWQLAVNARKRGYEVYILTDGSRSFIREEVKIIGAGAENRALRIVTGLLFWLTVDKKKFHELGFLNIKDKFGVAHRAWILRKILYSVRPDIIHVHSLHNNYSLSLKLIGRNLPLVITNYEFYPGDGNQGDIKIADQVLGFADYLVCISKYTRERLAEFGLNYQGKVKVIHIPIESDRLPLLKKEKVRQELGWGDKKTVFFAGAYEPIKKKGLDILLKAFSTNRYLSDRCRLIIISNSEGRNWARKFLEGDDKRIEAVISGSVPWDKMVNYYNAADVFVMPSRSEGFGIVYAEALLAGTPVVGFHKTMGEIESVLDIYIGERFDAGNEDERELSEKILKVLQTPFDRELTRSKVIEKLSWKTMFREFQSVYNEVLKK